MAEPNSHYRGLAATILTVVGFVTIMASLFIRHSSDPFAVRMAASDLWAVLMTCGIALGIWRIYSLVLLIPIVMTLWPHSGDPAFRDYLTVLSGDVSPRAIVSLFLALNGGVYTGLAVRLRDRGSSGTAAEER